MTFDAELLVPHPGPSRGRTLLAIAVLTVIGPLFVSVPVSLSVAAGKMMASSPQMQLIDPLGLLLFGLLIGYVVGWPYALLTGVIVAAWSLWRQPTFFVALTAALAANAILYFAAPVLATWRAPYRSTFEAQDFIVFSVITVSICWLIFRRMARR